MRNPIGTMDTLAEILRIDCVHTRARLNFLDDECLDIGPFLVLQALRQHMTPVFTGGTMNLDIQRIIDAVGLRAPLEIAPFKGLAANPLPGSVWPFRLRQRRGSGSSRSDRWQIEPQTKELVVDQFIEAVDKWLAIVADAELTRSGRRLVEKMIGEALDNAERHSTPGSNDGGWSIAACLVRRVHEGAPMYKLYLALLSVGATIAGSIATGPDQTVSKMRAYVARHRRSCSSEALETVFALQDGVTKDHNAAAEGRGGTGLQDIFAFFHDLGATPSPLRETRLVIISGKTCVVLDAPYPRGEEKRGPRSERELWFNRLNDPALPPDLSHVFGLPCILNGTLVSMVVTLDPEYLRATAGDGEH